MTALDEERFWETQRPESRIKALLVSEYFPQYCRIVDRGKGEGFVYVDLWAGRGRYTDLKLSTSLLLGDIISKDENLRNKVTFAFNDLKNKDVLERNFTQRFPEGTFLHTPRFGDQNAESSQPIKDYLNGKNAKQTKINNPSLLFFDPFGYAGIDTSSLSNFLKPWGNELFLFLNVNRVIPALTNPKMVPHISAMFPTLKDQVIKEIKLAKNDEKKVSLLIKFLADEFRCVLGQKMHHCAFKFMESEANKTSHLIIHFTKHAKGYQLVKQVFYDYDNIGAILGADGTFTFDAKKAYPKGIIDFSLDDNHINLSEQLANEFSGKQITAAELVDQHNPNSPYAPTHYVKALRRLVDENRLVANFTDNIEHRVSVLPTESCILKFPIRNG